jgi:hypothetical protein
MEDRFRGAEQCWKISGPDLLAKSRGLLAPRSIEETKRRPAYAGHNEFSQKYVLITSTDAAQFYWEMAFALKMLPALKLS